MKRLQYLIAALLLTAAVLVGVSLPRLSAKIQENTTEDATVSYEIDAVSLDYSTEYTLVEKYAVITSASDVIQLDSGRYLTQAEACKICADFLDSVFSQQSAAAQEENTGVSSSLPVPMLAAAPQAGNLIFWRYETLLYDDLFGNVLVTLYVDDITGQILEMNMQNMETSLYENLWNSGVKTSNMNLDDVGPEIVEEVLDKFASAYVEEMRKNLGFDTVEYEKSISEFCFGGTTLYMISFGMDSGESVMASLEIWNNFFWFGFENIEGEYPG